MFGDACSEGGRLDVIPSHKAISDTFRDRCGGFGSRLDRGFRVDRYFIFGRSPGGSQHHVGGEGFGVSTMDTMVGGTLGGSLGGITTAIVGIHGSHTAMALMTASMAGMVGGVFGGR